MSICHWSGLHLPSTVHWLKDFTNQSKKSVWKASPYTFTGTILNNPHNPICYMNIALCTYDIDLIIPRIDCMTSSWLL